MNLGLWFGLAAGCGGAAAPVGAAPEAAERIVLPGPVFGGPPLLGRATVDVDGPISPLAARLATRWVGRLPEGMSTCPQPSSGFTVEPLFGPGAPGQLARYCLYLASIQDPPPLQVIQPPQGFEIDADLQVLTSQARAGALTDVMVGPYQDLFEQQVERFPPSGPAAGPLPRLVLVDTSPTPPPGRAPWEVPGRDVHGYTLANMAHNQGCDAAGECAAKIESRLGLQLIKDAAGRVVPDELHGGEFGTISYLASAVFGALSSGGPGGGPVIINLSLGWDPEWGGDLAQRATWHPGIRAMYDVLYHAACRGALVFAAAGNRLGGPPPDDQPLYPAGWEKVEIEAGACLDVSGVPAAAGVTLDQPIVWAVGGVDEYGNDLALSRKDSRPGLVAFGSHGVTTDGAGAPTAILTGTSVSTLVASIAAAAVWSNLPSLRPIDVVQTLRDSGVPAGPVAPYWCPAGCGDAAWIDVCEAVRHACETGPTAGRCVRTAAPIVCDSAAPIVPAPAPIRLAAVAAATPDVHPSYSRVPRHHPACGGAGVGLHFSSPALAPEPCPLEQYYTARAEPWVNPQPMHEECPPCFLEAGKGRLWIEWKDPVPALQSVTLGVDKGTGTFDYWTTLDVPTSGYTVEYWVPVSVTTGAQRAWVTGTMSPTLSYSAAIQVLP